MNISDLKSSVLGKSNVEIPDVALLFAINFYSELQKQIYYQTDVADCISLARKISTFAKLCQAELRMVEAIEKLIAAMTKERALLMLKMGMKDEDSIGKILILPKRKHLAAVKNLE